jgi:hypothetical protein
MKQKLIAFCLVAFLFAACNNEKKAEDDKKEASGTETKTENTDSKPAENKDAPPMDMAAMQKAWEDYMKPGDMHKWLEKTNGTWVCDSLKQWMDGPNPTYTKATNVQSSALGGRYVIGKFTGSAMGMPMEGMSTMGYDNAKKMFVSTWMDNMGTGIVHMSGTYDEATKMLNLKGHQTDPMTGKDSDMREEMKMMDDNTYWMAIYGAGMDGKEQKFMEGTFKKKK